MKNILYLFAGLTFCGLAAGCKPTFDAPTPSTSNLNLSRYVAVGDYITAGFMNGGVSRESQEIAYPAILARQFAAAGAGAISFEQPYFTGGGTQMVDLSLNQSGLPVLSNTEEFNNFLLAGCNNTQKIIPDQYSTSAGQTASLQNLGVPGLKIRQINLGGLGNDDNVNKSNSASQPAFYNPYFDRMLPAKDNRTYLEVVRNSKPTFFTLWVGMADIINYAMSGANCGRLPTSAEFTTEFTNLLDSLSSGGKRPGVVCNIPSVQYLGFANSIAVQTNFQTQRNNPDLKIWIKALRIYNAPTLGYDTIAITAKDFITPTGLGRLGVEEQITVGGVTRTLPHGLDRDNPLLENEVLDSKEADYLESFVSTGRSASNPSMNTIINSILTAKNSKYAGNVAFANMQELYGSLFKGSNLNGVLYSLTPVSGGFYSYDYFSPTPRGQAIIANKIIQTINIHFKTNIFEVNVNDFQGFRNP